jgi:hypothetical protein
MSTTTIMRWQPTDLALNECWQLIRDGIEYGMLQDGDLPRLLGLLQRRNDLILDELGFEFLGDSLRVRFRDDECTCEPAAFIAELEAAMRGSPTEGDGS